MPEGRPCRLNLLPGSCAHYCNARKSFLTSLMNSDTMLLTASEQIEQDEIY